MSIPVQQAGDLLKALPAVTWPPVWPTVLTFPADPTHPPAGPGDGFYKYSANASHIAMMLSSGVSGIIDWLVPPMYPPS